MNILTCWIGNTDLVCAERDDPENLGPIVQALSSEPYDRVVLLDNYRDGRVAPFLKWVESKTGLFPDVQQVSLSSPTAHKEIYIAARELVQQTQTAYPDAKVTFHISPGTPAMALCWFLLAPTCGARVVESSRERGVQQVNFPFEVSAYFLPDKELARLATAPLSMQPAFKNILFKSEVMQQVVLHAQHAAARNVTVLIEGESGTGKELFARAIHEASGRATGPFVPVNCGAFPAELIESLLFGHTKSAFTGAAKDTDGFFQSADKGTLFLDELGELPQKAQVSLLRAIQEGKVTRVGETKAKAVDVRIIAATNRNLLQEVADGKFRSDLFYRLAVACLSLPPLRDRGEDIELLLDFALKHANQELSIHGQNEDKKFSDSAKKIMLSHSWPGNVRELVNTVTRAVLWTSGSLIDSNEARRSLFSLPQREQSILERPIGEDFMLEEVLGEVARHYIGRAMRDSGEIKSTAAKLLGFKTYQTLSNWMKRYDIQRRGTTVAKNKM